MNLTVLGIAISVVAILLLLQQLHIRKLSRRLVSMENKTKEMDLVVESCQQSIHSLHARIEEAEANIFATHRATQPIPKRLDDIEGKLREQLQQDPQVRLYQKAASMAQQGATADEIASECDLPLAEASVLVSLHSPK